MAIIILGEEKIDMQRMKTIIERNILEYVTNLENNPHDTIAFIMIGDLLYGDNAFDVSSIELDLTMNN